MSGPSSIEWTEKTWNPIRGCSRVSPGCERCYAETIAERFSGPGQPFEGFAERDKGWSRKVSLVSDHLADPLSWRKPARVFVNSMSDLFHEALSNEESAAVLGVMAACPQHTFQVLTKRARRMREWFEWVAEARNVAGGDGEVRRCLGLSDSRGVERRYHIEYPKWPLPNLWLGVSVESQKYADERIPELLDTPAAVRFVSAEPLLGPVDLYAFMRSTARDAALRGMTRNPALPGLDWCIVGGESGSGARPFHLDWARSIVAQCKASGVPCFVKQMGAYPVHVLEGREHMDPVRLKLSNRKGGDTAEWPAGDWPRELPR